MLGECGVVDMWDFGGECVRRLSCYQSLKSGYYKKNYPVLDIGFNILLCFWKIICKISEILSYLRLKYVQKVKDTEIRGKGQPRRT